MIVRCDDPVFQEQRETNICEIRQKKNEWMNEWINENYEKENKHTLNEGNGIEMIANEMENNQA